MTKDVLVSISGLQFIDDQDQAHPIELITPGEYYCRNGKHYILYDEVMEGFEGVTKNRIKIQDNCLDITKKGISNVHMVFEKNKKNMTCYETPFGNLMLGINANQIDFKQTEDSIDVSVNYVLDVNYEPLADCQIQINVTSKGAGNFSLSSAER